MWNLVILPVRHRNDERSIRINDAVNIIFRHDINMSQVSGISSEMK
jgi:hypothetical protein